MAAYVTHRRGNTNTTDTLWYVGTSREYDAIRVDDIIAIQADGHELEHIRRLFPMLTATTPRVVYWYGDVARTIALNLRIASY